MQLCQLGKKLLIDDVIVKATRLAFQRMYYPDSEILVVTCVDVHDGMGDWLDKLKKTDGDCVLCRLLKAEKLESN